MYLADVDEKNFVTQMPMKYSWYLKIITYWIFPAGFLESQGSSFSFGITCPVRQVGMQVHLSPTIPYLGLSLLDLRKKKFISFFIEWSQGDKRLSLFSYSMYVYVYKYIVYSQIMLNIPVS